MIRDHTSKIDECLDVAVIGGGPAGISAGIALSKQRGLKVALFERSEHLGGMPRSCHFFFGLRDQKRLTSGPGYARRLSRKLRETPVRVRTGASVLKVAAGKPGCEHRLEVLSPNGMACYRSRFVLLATGCCESSRHQKRVPGTRPAGVFTTGTLQQLVNVDGLGFHGRRAVIVGSEAVAFSCAWTLKSAGAAIAAMVEEHPELHCRPFVAEALRRWCRFPIYRDTRMVEIVGDDRVRGVVLEMAHGRGVFHVPCDMVVFTGRFRPESSLIEGTEVERDPASLGPRVNGDLLTSVPNIFAAGNVLRGADMHDLCALEGRMAARCILALHRGQRQVAQDWIPLQATRPIRYVVPQRVAPGLATGGALRRFLPVPSIQVAETIRNASLSAWSGSRQVWGHSFRRLIAHHRYPLALEKFDWRRVDSRRGIVLRID